MTTKQFKTGDVVTAKMGGPKMTVMAVNNKHLVHCMWFDQMYALHHGWFDDVALKPAPAR